MKSVALLFLLVGIILVVIGYTKTTLKCPPPRVEYRFVPRTFFEEQLSPDQVSTKFQDMFSQSESWWNRVGSVDEPEEPHRGGNFVTG